MRRLHARIVLMIMSLVTFTLVGAGTALAVGPYGSTSATVSNSSPPAGGTVTVSAGGYQPGSQADYVAHSTPVDLGKATVDANGNVQKAVTIPASFAPGSHHTIDISGTGANGAPLTRSVSLTLAGGSGSGSLPFTGADHVAEVVAIGVLLVVAGSLTVVVTRRRRHGLSD